MIALVAVHRFVCHSRRVLQIASRYGWQPAARYTNLRDVRCFDSLGLLDIEWRRYDFRHHLRSAKSSRPFITVARDILHVSEVTTVVREARQLLKYARHVVIVPKAPELATKMQLIPKDFLLGFSVPTRYGATALPPEAFDRPVHLLGGRPDVQRALADRMPVFSFDCNRFTLDATFGDYFDGVIFRPHPVGGYVRCLSDSLENINTLWRTYRSSSSN